MKKMPYTHKRTNQSSFSRSLKHILKALGGATVSMGATFSLFLTSAQAASFVTTFSTDFGDVTLEWSGEDEDGFGLITGNELSGGILVSFGGFVEDLGVSEFDVSSFVYNTVSSQLDLRLYNFDNDRALETLSDGSLILDLGADFPIGGFLGIAPQQSVSSLPNGGAGNQASTPEPTLTLGLITLGGLMLGSRKKVKA